MIDFKQQVTLTPKAWGRFEEWLLSTFDITIQSWMHKSDPIMPEMWVGVLEKFFRDQAILTKSEWWWNEQLELQWSVAYLDVPGDHSDWTPYFDSQPEAQAAGFKKAFEILNERLKNER